MLRLFIAVTLPEAALEACTRETARVASALGPFARGVKLPRAEGLHFTLKFLGWTPEEQAETIRSALERAAAEHAPFPMILKGLQAFPSTKKPRVIFLDVSEGGPAMSALAASVEKHVAPLGFPSEDRGFTAHVTLARVKDPKLAPRVGERIAALEPVEVARVDVKDVVLMLSELHPTGSRYTALARLALAARDVGSVRRPSQGT
jgi:RNA 2',3'-cyclic 3'-phosphodiesterase